MYNSIQNVATVSDAQGLQQQTKVQIFQKEEFGQVRTTIDENGEPLFCLADICKSVGLTNPSSVKQRLDEDETYLIDYHTLNSFEGGTNPFVTFITESGFYEVLLFSNSPKVKPFRKWITSEVLPSIRKTGSYNIQQQLPQDYLSALKALVKSEEEKQQLAIENARLDTENNILTKENCEANEKLDIAINHIKRVNPKARSWEKLANTEGLFTISQFASKIGLTAYKVNKFLVEKGIITNNKQRPTYKYIDKHFFECKELLIKTLYGEKKKTQMFITTTGEEFVTNLLYQDGIINIVY